MDDDQLKMLRQALENDKYELERAVAQADLLHQRVTILSQKVSALETYLALQEEITGEARPGPKPSPILATTIRAAREAIPRKPDKTEVVLNLARERGERAFLFQT